MATALSKKIKELRELAGDSQKQMAKKTGINYRQITRFENAQAVPKAWALAKIGEVYKYDLSTWLSSHTSPHHGSHAPQETAQAGYAMPEVMRENTELLKFIRDQLLGTQSHTNIEFAATLHVLRRWLFELHVKVSGQRRSQSAIDSVETAFDTEVKQEIQHRQKTGSKRN